MNISPTNVFPRVLRLLSTRVLAATAALLFCHGTAFGQIAHNGNLTNGTSPVIPYNGTDNPWDHGSSNLIVGHTAEGNLFVFGGFEVRNAQGTLGQNVGVTGEATINGAGALWTNTAAGTLTIGVSGEGILNIQNGGKVTGFRGVIASNGTGTVTLTDGAQWINSEDLTMADSNNTTATLNIESGSIVTNVRGEVGRGGLATATVTGGGSQWNNSSTLLVGRSGMGILNIEDGGLVSNTDATVGQQNSGATSTVTVDGIGSRWDNVDVTLGFVGNATLNVSGGGLVTSLRSILGERSGSTGTATVSGAGSQWDNSSDFFVGGDSTDAGGTGTLNIQNDGSVLVATTMKVWDDGTVNLMSGTLEVFRLDLTAPTATDDFNMTGGRLTVSNEILGTFQQDGGTLAANSFSAIDISMDYVMNAGTNEFEIGGTIRGFQYDAFDVTGDSLLNGTMDIDLVSGFAPSLGQSFQLIDSGSYSGTPLFDFSDAMLASGLFWDTSSFLTDGTISIVPVPEPSSFALLALAAGAGALSKRRRRRASADENRS